VVGRTVFQPYDPASDDGDHRDANRCYPQPSW
jgi:hypothetical protein